MTIKHLAAAVCLAAASLSAAAPKPAAPALAWIRFAQTPKAYADTPYLWLGDGDIQFTVNVKPAAGHVLELHWGAKGDTRTAALTVNGKPVTASSGGYDGFRWLRVALPEGLTGTQYQIVMKRTAGTPAFIGAARLTGPGDQAVDTRKAAHLMTVKSTARPMASRPGRSAGPAFPDMQKLWDTPAPPPATPLKDEALEAAFTRAERNARQAAEQFFRCRKFVSGWLATADKTTGLISRNLGRDRGIWNAKDSAADNYPYMVLTAALTDRELFNGRMLDMLRTETRLTSRIGRLPDTWSFKTQAFASSKPNLGSIIFGSSEYVKDGLLPLTEWLGASPWSQRMIGIVDDIFANATVDTPYGKIPSTNIEVNGEMLQSLSRIYWMTGDKKYLDWAVRLGDYYLLGNHHPTKDLTSLRLRDHGCEITDGLAELYVTVSFARPAKKKAYHDPIHAMFDRILAVGCNEHGMMYNTINPKTGSHDRGLCDTWGYNYNGVYAVYMVDKTPAYRAAVRKALGNLNAHYKDYNWRGADSFADSIEGAVCLFNREQVPSVEDWLDSEIRDMWRPQRPDGIVEGWHGDGNSARTAIMYALLKTQGLHVRPWRADVRIGAVLTDKGLCISLAADKPWTGRILFDRPRHKVQMHLPMDYPRINQFPEWYTVKATARYAVQTLPAAAAKTHTGAQLQAGLPVDLPPARQTRLLVTPAPAR